MSRPPPPSDRASTGRYAPVVLTVSVAGRADEELAAAFARLIPQLSSSSPPPTRDQLAEMIESSATTVFLARNEQGTIVGTLTLVVFRIPSAIRAWIEDVVVDGAARGSGAGEALNRAALETAKKLGARTVDLTSRPSREAANRLYQRLGFQRRETNVYRYDLL